MFQHAMFDDTGEYPAALLWHPTVAEAVPIHKLTAEINMFIVKKDHLWCHFLRTLKDGGDGGNHHSLSLSGSISRAYVQLEGFLFGVFHELGGSMNGLALELKPSILGGDN